jgi:hypothetical protein
MNSRGRQPTERRDETDSTLKGSHHKRRHAHSASRCIDCPFYCAALSGPVMIGNMFRGLHPRLFTFVHLRRTTAIPMTRPAICSAHDLQHRLDIALATCLFPSAKRMNMNSRGRQPTERRDETDSTLKGSHHTTPPRTFRIPMRFPFLLFGPFRAGDDWGTCSVGCTHGYSHLFTSGEPRQYQ